MIPRAALVLHMRLRARKVARAAAATEPLGLGPGAAAVLRYALEHGCLSTQRANDLLERAQPLTYRRTPRRGAELAKAREVLLELVDAGHLAFGLKPDTWKPSPALRQAAQR